MVLHRSCCRCSTRGDYGIRWGFVWITWIFGSVFVAYAICPAFAVLSQRRHQNPGEVKTMCWCVLLLIRPSLISAILISLLFHLVAFCYLFCSFLVGCVDDFTLDQGCKQTCYWMLGCPCLNSATLKASLQSVVGTALRWDARHVKRVPGNEGPRWEDDAWLEQNLMARMSFKLPKIGILPLPIAQSIGVFEYHTDHGWCDAVSGLDKLYKFRYRWGPRKVREHHRPEAMQIWSVDYGCDERKWSNMYYAFRCWVLMSEYLWH